MKPAWLKLIEQWEAEHHFGLTIPFLLGALQDWPGQPLGVNHIGVGQMRALLASIRDDSPDGITMRLYTCDKRHELILASVAYPYLPDYCIAIPSASKSKPSLYVEKGIVTDDTDPFEALVSELWLRYSAVIQAGCFSLQDGAFRPFNEYDHGLIHAATVRHDDDDV